MSTPGTWKLSAGMVSLPEPKVKVPRMSAAMSAADEAAGDGLAGLLGWELV